MSKSHHKQKAPALPGQTKTMFCSKGTPAASLVTEALAGHRVETYWFPHPSNALDWCLKHGANLVFTQAAPNN